MLRNRWLFFTLCFLFSCPLVFAQSGVKKDQTGNLEKFEYRSEKMRDPFQPITLRKIIESKSKTGKFTGYELDELRIVGIIMKEKERFVMIEDKEGKGIVLKKGDFINENTWIYEIGEKDVIFAYKLKGELKKISMQIPSR